MRGAQENAEITQQKSSLTYCSVSTQGQALDFIILTVQMRKPQFGEVEDLPTVPRLMSDLQGFKPRPT